MVKPITIDIDKNLWESFKNRVNRNTKLNDALVLLIKDFVEEDEYEICDLNKVPRRK